MLDIKLVRSNPELVRENIKKKFQEEKLPLVDEVLELDSQFHTRIADAAQNPMLATITEYITRLTLPSRLETTRRVIESGDIEFFVDLHRRLLTVIERRQMDLIPQTVQDHYVFWK